MTFSKYTSLPLTVNVLVNCFVLSSLPLILMVALCHLHLLQPCLLHTPTPAGRTICSRPMTTSFFSQFNRHVVLTFIFAIRVLMKQSYTNLFKDMFSLIVSF